MAREFCTFYVDRLFLGIEVWQVQEVLRHQVMTAVPLAPKVVAGLINLRGQIVTAIDLRARLGLPVRPQDELAMNVVVRYEDGVVSLLVDEIGDVVNVSESDFESSPNTLPAEARQLIRGVFKLKGGLLHLLNLERVVGGQAADHGSERCDWSSSLPPAAA